MAYKDKESNWMDIFQIVCQTLTMGMIIAFFIAVWWRYG